MNILEEKDTKKENNSCKIEEKSGGNEVLPLLLTDHQTMMQSTHGN